MIYVASPYSHPKQSVRTERFVAVQRFVAAHIRQQVLPLFSPIVYGHQFSQVHNFSTDAKSWTRFNFGMLQRSQFLWVLELPGWEDSKGVQAEINLARELNIPVFYKEPV